MLSCTDQKKADRHNKQQNINLAKNQVNAFAVSPGAQAKQQWAGPGLGACVGMRGGHGTAVLKETLSKGSQPNKKQTPAPALSDVELQMLIDWSHTFSHESHLH